jgi:hypothetical protein
MKQNKQIDLQSRYNDAVELAHTKIFKFAKQLIATIERDDMRCYFERKDSAPVVDTIRHEIISPLLYLRLQCELDGMFTIRFGIEPAPSNPELADLTSDFLRMLFRATDKAAKDVDIERCIETDWFINVCGDMYEYVDTALHSKHHTLRKVPYKGVTSHHRKKLTVV